MLPIHGLFISTCIDFHLSVNLSYTLIYGNRYTGAKQMCKYLNRYPLMVPLTTQQMSRPSSHCTPVVCIPREFKLKLQLIRIIVLQIKTLNVIRLMRLFCYGYLHCLKHSLLELWLCSQWVGCNFEWMTVFPNSRLFYIVLGLLGSYYK